MLGSVIFMIPRVANRAFVGLPLCRDEDFLSPMRGFTTDVVSIGFIFRFTLTWLRTLVGPLAAMPKNRNFKQGQKYTSPSIIERLTSMKWKVEDPGFQWEPPNDCLIWFITTSPG